MQSFRPLFWRLGCDAELAADKGFAPLSQGNGSSHRKDHLKAPRRNHGQFSLSPHRLNQREPNPGFGLKPGLDSCKG